MAKVAIVQIRRETNGHFLPGGKGKASRYKRKRWRMLRGKRAEVPSSLSWKRKKEIFYLFRKVLAHVRSIIFKGKSTEHHQQSQKKTNPTIKRGQIAPL